MKISDADETAWNGTSSSGIVLGSSYNVDENSASSRITIESTWDGRRRMLEGFKSSGCVSLKIVTAAFILIHQNVQFHMCRADIRALSVYV